MKHEVKIDWWFLVLLVLPFIATIILLFTIDSSEDIWSLFFVIILLILLIFGIVFSYYELGEEHLIIFFFFFKQRIRYDNVRSVRLVQNLYSSSAPSIYRIEIKEYNKGRLRATTFISPKNREYFLEELKRRCNRLEDKKHKEISI